MIVRVDYGKQPIKSFDYKDNGVGEKYHSNTRGSLPIINTTKDSIQEKVSIFEGIDNTETRVMSAQNQTGFSNAEYPTVDFTTLLTNRKDTPQINTIGLMMTEMITGTDLNVNSEDEEAKQICEEFANKTDLYEKIKSIVDVGLTTGFEIFARVRGEKNVLKNIEEFDMRTVVAVQRDAYGNNKKYIISTGSKYAPIDATDDLIPVYFNRLGREPFGLSYFHSMAITRQIGNRKTRPLVKALQSLDDVVIGTLENFAWPVQYITLDNLTPEQLKEESQKYKDMKPGDMIVGTKKPDIDRREPTTANFAPYIDHFKNLLQHGTGFPLDMLTGDFASRASSQTADSFFMRRIKAYQKQIVNMVKRDIFEELLRSIGWKDTRIQKAAITVEFESHTSVQYTPEIVADRVDKGIWTKKEARQYDKSNGQDLFDDDEIDQDEEQQDTEDQTQTDPQAENLRIAQMNQRAKEIKTLQKDMKKK